MSKLKAKYSLHLFVHECSWKGKYMHIYIYICGYTLCIRGFYIILLITLNPKSNVAP